MTNKSPRSIFYGWVIVVAGCLILFLEWGFQYSYGVFFTELCTDLDWTRTMVSGAYSLGFLWHSVIYLPAGRLNDRYGPRLALAISIIVLSAGYALMSIINAPWQLYIFYGIVVGTGMGFGLVPVVSTVSRWFVARRGIALGITLVGTGMGTLALVPLAQFLIFKFDWRNSYLLIAGILLVIGLSISQLMRLHPSEKGLLPYGINEMAEGSKHNNLLSTVDFTFKQAIKTKAFWLLFTMYVFLSFVVQMVMVHLKAYAIDFGIAEMTAATALGLVGGTSIAGRIVIGSLSDRIGRKACFFVAYLLMVLMMLWLIEARQPWQFYLFAAIFGFGQGSYVPLFPAVVADWFGTKSHGTIYGAIMLATGIGGAIGPLLAGYIYDTRGSYSIAIIIGAVVLFIALGCAFAIKAPQRLK